MKKINYFTILSEGDYLVNFKKPEHYFGNDPLPAHIIPCGPKNRIDIKWNNGYSARMDRKHVNIWTI